VTVGIDAAVTANHHVVVRLAEPGGVGLIVEDFTVPPTLDGLARLRERLAARDVRLAVAEPTSMTWLGLSIALREAGIDLALLGSRHVARLRGALSGKSKSDSTRSCCRAPVSCSLCSPRRCRTRPRWRCSAPAVADTSC
jgi:hypothetical protein